MLFYIIDAAHAKLFCVRVGGGVSIHDYMRQWRIVNVFCCNLSFKVFH
jgi:hypothetical protein